MDANVTTGTGTMRWSAHGWERLRGGAVPLAFAAIVLAATAIRWWGLEAKSLWFDETFSVLVAQQPLTELVRLLHDYDTHPPLHYALLHFWIVAFGQDELAVRSLSVIASVIVVSLTFLLGRRFAGDRVGLLSAALLAISPFQVVSAQEARMYPFLTLFAAGASYALWLALEEGRTRHWVAYTVLSILAVYTHHFAWFILLAQALYVVLFHRRDGRLGTWVLSMVVLAIAYSPLFPLLQLQLTTARAWPDFRPPFGIGAVTDTLGLFSFGGSLFGMGTYFRRGTLPLLYRPAVLLPFLLLAVCGVLGLRERRKQAFLVGYWAVPIAAVALISLVRNMYYERYFSFVLPPFLILLAAGVFYVADEIRRPARAVSLTALLLLLASFNIPALIDAYAARSTYNWRSAAAYVTIKAKDNDFILFIPGFARIPFEYYYEGRQQRASYNPVPLLRSSGPVFSVRLQANNVTEIARAHPRMWIVATVPLGYDTRKSIGSLLSPAFEEIEGKDFGLVFTYLWRSRLYAGLQAPHK